MYQKFFNLQEQIQLKKMTSNDIEQYPNLDPLSNGKGAIYWTFSC